MSECRSSRQAAAGDGAAGRHAEPLARSPTRSTPAAPSRSCALHVERSRDRVAAPFSRVQERQGKITSSAGPSPLECVRLVDRVHLVRPPRSCSVGTWRAWLSPASCSSPRRLRGSGQGRGRAQPGVKLTPAAAHRLDVGAQEKVEETGVPGATAAVVFADGREWSGAAGDAVLHPRRPMTTATAIPFDSITKVVTASTAMRLVEQGRLASTTRSAAGTRPGAATPRRPCATCSATRRG